MTQRPQRRGKPGLIALLLSLALVIAGIDQVTKYLAEEHLTPGVVIPLVGDYLGLQLIYNPGAAFSLATGMTWVLTVIMVVVIVVILRVSRRLRSTTWAFALGMLLGGAVGNLYDRLLRDPGFGRGHVVDFINYNGWFVGNVADIAIVLAAVLIALLALRGVEVDGTRATDPDEPEPPASTSAEDLGEEPLEDEDFSPEVPRASDEPTVDVASWVAGAPSVSAGGHPPTGDGAVAPQSTGTQATDDEPGTPEPAARPGPAAGPPDSESTRSVLPSSSPADAAPRSPASPAIRDRAHPRRRPTRREIRLTQQDDDG